MFSIFQKKSIGIDIADHTIEAVELTKKGIRQEISSQGRVLLESGIVERGRIKDEKKLAEAVKQIFSKAKPHPIKGKELIFGLPENQVYIYIFELGPHKKKQREDLILKEAQTNIPLEKDDLLFSYKILDKSQARKEVLLVAASKKQVLEWQQFFQKLGLEVEIFDIESLATFRGLFNKPSKVPICLVDIGAATTNIAVFDKRGLRYSRSINVAGDIFTQEIAKALEIKPEKAEEQKIKIGLSDENSQIFPVLIKLLEPISKEVKTLLNYFQEKNNQPVQEIILVGGSSKLKGIDAYFKENLELPIKIGKLILPFRTESLEYIEAVGLALRGLEKKWSQKDPGLQPIKFKADKPTKDLVFKEKLSSLENVEKEEESVFTSVAERERKKKLGFRKVLLITILIIGLIIIGLAYWYRSYEKAQKEKEIESQIVQYTQAQSKEEKEDEEEKGPEEEEEIPEKIPEISESVVIKETPTGWLRVREEPGIGYPEIAKVYPGESYSLLEESGEWYKIKIDEEIEGWVFSIYVNKVNE